MAEKNVPEGRTKEAEDGCRIAFGGLFQSERVNQFRVALTKLADGLFDDLRNVSWISASKGSGGTVLERQKKCFQKGLDMLKGWELELKEAETTKSVEKFPELELLYNFTLVTYVKEVYTDQSTAGQQVQFKRPTFRDFLMSFYVHLGAQKPVREMEYMDLWGLQKSVLIVETIRTCLFEITRNRVTFQPVPETKRTNPSLSVPSSVQAEPVKNSLDVPRPQTVEDHPGIHLREVEVLRALRKVRDGTLDSRRAENPGSVSKINPVKSEDSGNNAIQNNNQSKATRDRFEVMRLNPEPSIRHIDMS